MSQFECDGWKTIIETAEMLGDDKLLTRIRGHDLFACEAKYHKSCRTRYMQNPAKWRSKTDAARENQAMFQINGS